MTDSTPRTPAGTFTSKREPGESLSREELAGMLSDIVKKLHLRLTAARYKEHATDSGLLSMCRAFTTAVSALDSVLKNEQIDEIEDRITSLERKREHEKPNTWR